VSEVPVVCAALNQRCNDRACVAFAIMLHHAAQSAFARSECA
jgi:hypothetical protein